MLKKWTRFVDMYSGGELKEKFSYLYVELPEEKAKVFFYNRFGHNPERITCTCCGDDYNITEEESLEQIAAFEREAKGKPLKEYLKSDEARVIYKKDIKDIELIRCANTNY